jgi:hypothetical protein
MRCSNARINNAKSESLQPSVFVVAVFTASLASGQAGRNMAKERAYQAGFLHCSAIVVPELTFKRQHAGEWNCSQYVMDSLRLALDT